VKYLISIRFKENPRIAGSLAQPR